MKNLIIFLVFILEIFGCGNPGKLAGSARQKELERLKFSPPPEGSNKIAFFTFSVSETDTLNNKYEFALLKTIFVNGTLKKSDPTLKEVHERNYFYCKLEYGDLNENETIKIEDPINRIFEFPSTNAALGKTLIHQVSGRFTLRFQYHKDIQYLTIFKTNNRTPDTLNVIYHAGF